MNLSHEHFKKYVKETRGVSDRTVLHYITGLQTINLLLKEKHYRLTNVFCIDSLEDLEEVKQFLDNNDEYQVKDVVGHRMYSVAFKHFYRYAYRFISSEE